VKFNKSGGRYLTIPFRVGTPDIVGDSDVFSRKMSVDVYEVVKAKEVNIPSRGGGSRSAGLTMKELPPQYQKRQTRAAIKDSEGKVLFEEYTHKAPLDQGLMKFTDAVTGQSTYGTFRRVSENSDPNAFIHPGIEKYNLIQKALDGFNQSVVVSHSLTNELEKLGLI
jgi:hypothetical protein